MHTVKLIAVFAENHLGQMARITKVFAGQNLRLLSEEEILNL